MRIDFKDGGYVEMKASQKNFDEISVIIGTRESPLKLNINTASLTRAEFITLVNEILPIKKEEK